MGLPRMVHAVVTPTWFTSFKVDPIGIAASRDTLYVLRGCTGGVENELHSLTMNGSAITDTLVATIPNSQGACVEGYLAISPGFGGFTANDVYITSTNTIWRYRPTTPTSGFLTPFATLPMPNTQSHTGITFDHVSTFGFQMILTMWDGRVYSIDPWQNITAIGVVPGGANVGLEGPEVTPVSFGTNGGEVFIADEVGGRVWAMSVHGVVTLIANVPDAESVHMIPKYPCSFLQTGSAMFTNVYLPKTNPTPAIYQWKTIDLAGFGGRMIVMKEHPGTGIYGSVLLTYDPFKEAYTLSNFGANVGRQEGSTFVDCRVPCPTCP